MYRLTDLLGIHIAENVNLTEMTLDSRTAKAGCLFVAIKGHQTDGRQYIPQALQNGASAVIFEADSEAQHLQVHYEQQVPLIAFYRLSEHLSHLADVFYGQPSKRLTLVGNRYQRQNDNRATLGTVDTDFSPYQRRDGHHW